MGCVLVLELENLINFIPEVKKILLTRYEILNYIKVKRRIGRRAISNELKMSERLVRDEAKILKALGFVDINSKGISVTETGDEMLLYFSKEYRKLNEISEITKAVNSALNLKNVIVVSSFEERDEDAFKNIGIAASHILEKYLKENYTIGVTGGRTMYDVSREVLVKKEDMGLKVIPARGSIGTNAHYQADTVASNFAKRLNARYYNYPVPDTLSRETIDLLLNTKEVSEVYKMLKDLDILFFGIGRADEMAKRRNLSEDEISGIMEKGACGEAFGHYFDIDGNIIYKQASIGIDLNEFLKIPIVVGVAAGEKKAKALISIANLRDDIYLVIDDKLAREVIKIKRGAK